MQEDVADITIEMLISGIQMTAFPLVPLTLLKTFLLLSAFDLIDSSTSGGKYRKGKYTAVLSSIIFAWTNGQELSLSLACMFIIIHSAAY